MLELDLIGHKLTLSDADAAVLLSAAERASGSSVGSRDLATRLKDAAAPSSQARRRRLVFSRPESRALLRLIQGEDVPGERFLELEAALIALLGQSQREVGPATPS
jgi:hypothetical protein